MHFFRSYIGGSPCDVGRIPAPGVRCPCSQTLMETGAAALTRRHGYCWSLGCPWGAAALTRRHGYCWSLGCPWAGSLGCETVLEWDCAAAADAECRPPATHAAAGDQRGMPGIVLLVVQQGGHLRGLGEMPPVPKPLSLPNVLSAAESLRGQCRGFPGALPPLTHLPSARSYQRNGRGKSPKRQLCQHNFVLAFPPPVIRT